MNNNNDTLFNINRYTSILLYVKTNIFEMMIYPETIYLYYATCINKQIEFYNNLRKVFHPLVINRDGNKY